MGEAIQKQIIEVVIKTSEAERASRTRSENEQRRPKEGAALAKKLIRDAEATAKKSAGDVVKAKKTIAGTERNSSAVFAQRDSATREDTGPAVWFKAPRESRFALGLVPAQGAEQARMRLIRVLIAPEENGEIFPPGFFPWEMAPPMGAYHSASAYQGH